MSELSLANAQALSSVVSDAAYPQGLLAWNMLVNAGIAVILVDSGLRIRLVTPAAASLFQLADRETDLALESLQEIMRDPAMLADAHRVLRDHETIEREVAVVRDRCYLRRMAPYRTTTHSYDGLVITLTDITARERVAKELKSAKQQAEMIGVANMRRLSTVCHELRQPLNTLGLIGGLLAYTLKDPLVQRLAQLLDESLQAMSGMLSSAHYACRLSAGSVRPYHSVFPIEDVFARLRREFSYHSGAHGLTLRIQSSGLTLRSDPALIEQMIRSLLGDMMDAAGGKLLLGCRRRSDCVRIEFWRSKRVLERRSAEGEAGVSARTGGSEVAKKLADLLGYRLRISVDARRPAFVIEVPVGAFPAAPAVASEIPAHGSDRRTEAGVSVDVSTVFIVDDDDAVLTTLRQVLQRPGL